MNPERLNELLRSLPREEASERFTPDVMRRTRSVRASSGSPARMVLAWAAAVVILITGAAGHWVTRQRDQVRLESIRAEQQQLERELDELKRISEEYSPVLRVNGNDGVDYVVDLNQFNTELPENRQISRVSSQIQ